MSIEYRKGNLFSAPSGVALIHAVNCQGSWGSGVAAGFRENFAYAFSEYQKHCRKHLPQDFRKRSDLVGTSSSTWDHKGKRQTEPFLICSLYTSDKYATHVDPPESIARATDTAMIHFLNDPNLKSVDEIHSPKMNAGLFNVPWEMTESVIEEHLNALNKRWIVWEF